MCSWLIWWVLALDSAGGAEFRARSEPHARVPGGGVSQDACPPQGPPGHNRIPPMGRPSRVIDAHTSHHQIPSHKRIPPMHAISCRRAHMSYPGCRVLPQMSQPRTHLLIPDAHVRCVDDQSHHIGAQSQLLCSIATAADSVHAGGARATYAGGAASVRDAASAQHGTLARSAGAPPLTVG